MKTAWNRTAVAVLIAIAAVFFAHPGNGSGGVAFTLKTPPEPVRSTMETVLTLTATGADGAPINLGDVARVKNLTLKTISTGANDIREYVPTPAGGTGAVQVKASFSFGGQYSVVIDGEIDSVKVHDLLFLSVAGPGERGD